MKFQDLSERCWKGYRQAGMKKKGDRQVPNCVPVEEVKVGPEITANQLLYKAAAMAMRDAGREGIVLDYEDAIKQASKIYGIPYKPSQLPQLRAQLADLDRRLAPLIAQQKLSKEKKKQAKYGTAPAATDVTANIAPRIDRIKPPTRTLEAVDPFLDNALRDALAVAILGGTAFTLGAYYTIRNRLKIYNTNQVVKALTNKITSFDDIYPEIKPLLEKFQEAVKQEDADTAQAVAKRIEQTIVMHRLRTPQKPLPPDRTVQLGKSTVLEKRETDFDNPRTQRIMRQLRAENPEAQSDLEALIFDYRKTQAQDREDIRDLLAQERQLRQQQAELVADLQDKERRFQELDTWAKDQGMTPTDTKDTAADIAAGKKPALPTPKPKSDEKPAVRSKAAPKKKPATPAEPDTTPAVATGKEKPVQRRKARKPTPKVKAEPTRSPALDKLAKDLTADPEQGDLFAEPITPQPTQSELPLRGGSNVVNIPQSTTPATPQPTDATVLKFPTRSQTPPWDPRVMKTGTKESVFRALYSMLQEEIVPLPGAMEPQPKLPGQDLAIQKALNMITLIVRGDPQGLIPDLRNDMQRLGYRFTKKPNGTMILVHTDSATGQYTQVPIPLQKLPQDVQQAVAKLTLVREQQPGKPRARRLHYFTVDSARTAQEYGLVQDRLGNWLMIEYDRSGEPFRRQLQAAIRVFGQPRSMTL